MNEHVVSVVAPCYNGEAYISRFFDSILRQTYPDIELVLVNDGSTDATEEIVRSYADRFRGRGISFVYKKQENAGQAAALNNGLKSCSGEYILWMDADDALSSRYIQACVLYFDQNIDCKYVYCSSEWIQESDGGATVNRTGKMESANSFFEDILYVRNVFFPGYMVRASALDQVIPGRNIYTGKGGQNAQMLLPLAWYYGRPDYVEDAIYDYYIRKNSHSHSISTSTKIIEQLKNYEAILTETIHRIPDEDAQHYIPQIQKHYAELRFGNAVDTKNRDLIRKYYHELITVEKFDWKRFALYIKYTNPLIRTLLHIEG